MQQQELKDKHRDVLRELLMDVLRALSAPNLDIRKKALDIALDLIDARNIDEVGGSGVVEGYEGKGWAIAVVVGGLKWQALGCSSKATHPLLGASCASLDAPPAPYLLPPTGGGCAEEGGDEDPEPGAGEGRRVPAAAGAGARLDGPAGGRLGRGAVSQRGAYISGCTFVRCKAAVGT